jgi:hypothetical protein
MNLPGALFGRISDVHPCPETSMANAKRIKTPSAAKTVGSTNVTAAPAAVAPTAEKIAVRAYQIWRESGCAHGNDQAHWFRAEQELRASAARGR